MFFQAEIDRPFLEKPYREALEKIIANPNNAKEIARETLMIADKGLEDCSKRYLSEDYLFCQEMLAPSVRRFGSARGCKPVIPAP